MANSKISGMDFGEALCALKNGRKVRRAGWNGKGMYIYLLERHVLEVKSGPLTLEPCIVMFTAQGCDQPGWLASQPDMLSDDWELVVTNG